MSKVYLVMQHRFDEVKLFEPIQLSPEAADAMVERLRASEKHDPSQPIEWRELEIDHTAAKKAVEHHTAPLKERIDALRASVTALEKGGVGQLLALRAAVRKVRTAQSRPGPWLIDFTAEERQAWESA